MNYFRTALLLAGLTALFMGVGFLIGGKGGAMIALVIAAATNLFTWWNSGRMVLSMYGAHEVDRNSAPDLYNLVAELASRAQLPMPRVFLMDEAQPNAFATGRNPEHAAVAVTEGLMEILDHRELRAVLAHELAHIRNRDILIASIAAASAALITWIAHALSFGALFGGAAQDDDPEADSAAGGLLVALVAPLAATLIQMAISRSREYQADETGARLCGDPRALASALLKLEETARVLPAQGTPATASLFIVNPVSALETVARWFSTHPSAEDRVRRLLELARRDAGTSDWMPVTMAWR
jgi:heat shock protein HtpX